MTRPVYRLYEQLLPVTERPWRISCLQMTMDGPHEKILPESYESEPAARVRMTQLEDASREAARGGDR